MLNKETKPQLRWAGGPRDILGGVDIVEVASQL
jgi:hypothetical protein